MISCRDVNNLQMDGMELVAGAAGLDRIVSWTYLVQTKPYKDHMNPGNFALLVVDYKRYSIESSRLISSISSIFFSRYCRELR